MADFHADNPSLKHYPYRSSTKCIIELKERSYTDGDTYGYALIDFEDVMDSYERVLEIVGEICEEVIALSAEDVNHEGPTVANGRVMYAPGTQQNLDAVHKAGLMGIAMPRHYSGLDLPIIPYITTVDLVPRVDTGPKNFRGLQDYAETSYEFGNEDQRQRYVPRVCNGETMSMGLTESDADFGLRSVILEAFYNKINGCWYLNGVKRFITNGDAGIHLVLARPEEGMKGGRGLSTFIYDKRNGGVNARRIESKMGIKGSPICELVFKNVKAELRGDRKLGLTKYVMVLMNGARLDIMARAMGPNEAIYRKVYTYALNRKQFGKSIIEFPAIIEIIALTRAKVDASRSMLYETACFVNVYKASDDIPKKRKLTPEERQESKRYSKLAGTFAPMGKGMTTGYADQNAYGAIQVHGGSGPMKDHACERIYRDVCITNIHEGTTQLQVVVVIRHVTTGTYLDQVREYQVIEYKPELGALKNKLAAMTEKYERVVTEVMGTEDNEHVGFQARRMVEAATHCVFGYLLLQDANEDDSFYRSAKVYVNYGQAEINKTRSFINNFNHEDLTYYKQQQIGFPRTE